ncbi:MULTISPECIES: ABC transporter permease [unclassified Cycloclasticus]|uniref:ABC transporter permease n=1 Tax=unclassified Cycloclasticus TaxID=2621467 RepID=UPI00059DF020|nr:MULTISPECIES: ABC transporter permease [unclassified Cycloclasticus]PHR50298.1 MAG: peptide ABC transporter permease [Cycloclasticus sp.]
MNWVDSGRWIFSSVLSYRSRSLLTALGMAVGIVSVTLLTAIGEGVQQYVLDSFSQFGARIIAINPGLKETHGAGGLLSSVRPLTLRDAQALKQLTGVEKVVPVVQGSGVVEFNNLQRSGVILGVGPDMSDAWDFKVAQGNFFSGNLEDARSTAVLGYTMKKELFGDSNPLGQHIRVGGQRFRVIGTIEKKGQMLGVDMDDTIYIPAQNGLQMFNRESLMEINVVFSANVTLKRIETRIKDLMIKRHGREDVTLTTQNDMLESMGKILSILKLSVGGLGAISLLVGAVGILAIMTTTVRERTAEVGLLRALGADKKTILILFLGEAAVLALMGGLLGLVLLFMLTGLLQLFLPGLPITFNLLFLGLALVMSAVIGLIAGVVPAGQAANLNPINALHEE